MIFFQEEKLAPAVLILQWPAGSLSCAEEEYYLCIPRQLQEFTTGVVESFPRWCPGSKEHQNTVPMRTVDIVFYGEVQRKEKKIWTFSSAQSHEGSWWWNKSLKSAPWGKGRTADTASPPWQSAPGICRAKTCPRGLALCLKASTCPQLSPSRRLLVQSWLLLRTKKHHRHHPQGSSTLLKTITFLTANAPAGSCWLWPGQLLTKVKNETHGLQ